MDDIQLVHTYIVMQIASWFLIHAGWTNDGRVGAAIFIVGSWCWLS
ncbi:hypothetical protein [Paenibacillus polymyxa]|nr:hypothetical protein [Paenibacillus polymyxa]MDQ0049220.1 hypothetical protein [Paenibacillus polymyxa]